jgi:hypothetical protein
MRFRSWISSSHEELLSQPETYRTDCTTGGGAEESTYLCRIHAFFCFSVQKYSIMEKPPDHLSLFCGEGNVIRLPAFKRKRGKLYE